MLVVAGSDFVLTFFLQLSLTSEGAQKDQSPVSGSQVSLSSLCSELFVSKSFIMLLQHINHGMGHTLTLDTQQI